MSQPAYHSGDRLPPPLDALWRGQSYGAVHAVVNNMAGVIVMAPRHELPRWRGVVVAAGLEMAYMPTAPVIRLRFEFRDGAAPFIAETFYNIRDERDREALGLLGQQDELLFHLFDARRQRYAYSKSISWRQTQRAEAREFVRLAEAHATTCQPYDFPAARAAFEATYPI